MAQTLTLSRGPNLTPGIDKGVHIIFYPPEGPGPEPSPEDLDAAASAINLAASASGQHVAPTDVVVIRDRPYHMVGGELKKHPEVHHDHPETMLDLKVEIQQGVWWSEEAFTIERIQPHGTPPPNAPSTPFPKPEAAPGPDAAGRDIHVARSRTPDKAARGAEYKLTFNRSNRPIDPNMRCS